MLKSATLRSALQAIDDSDEKETVWIQTFYVSECEV